MNVDRAINLRNLLGVEPNGFRRFFVAEKDVEMFLEACELKGLSMKTIGSYEQTMRLFISFQRTGDRADGEGDAHDGTELY